VASCVESAKLILDVVSGTSVFPCFSSMAKSTGRTSARGAPRRWRIVGEEVEPVEGDMALPHNKRRVELGDRPADL
jgi:hypothetical protein